LFCAINPYFSIPFQVKDHAMMMMMMKQWSPIQ